MDDVYSRAGNAADPPYLVPDYVGTRTRSPKQPLIVIPQTLSEITGPVYGHSDVDARGGGPHQAACGRAAGRAHHRQGPRARRGRAARAQHAGRDLAVQRRGPLRHVVDQHEAPLDPNFTGAGRCVTDADGNYQFVTIKPGAYPWRNHANAWRPAHIHLSLFGPSFLTRLVTQMYFPGDPLFAFDPIFNSVPDPKARERMVCQFDLEATKPEWALGYNFDIVLRGSNATPMDPDHA